MYELIWHAAILHKNLESVTLSVPSFDYPYSLFIFYFYFCIHLLPCRKASKTLYLEQAITPTCFQRFEDVVARLKLFIFILYFFKEMQLNFRTACQDRQARERAGKCFYQVHNKMARVAFGPQPFRSQSPRSKHSTTPRIRLRTGFEFVIYEFRGMVENLCAELGKVGN